MGEYNEKYRGRRAGGVSWCALVVSQDDSSQIAGKKKEKRVK